MIVIGRKGSHGKVNFSDGEVFAIDTTYFIDERFTRANLRWLSYTLAILGLDALSKDSAVPGLAREDAYGYHLATPPPEEQNAIAAFLDAYTLKIDTLVTRKRELIERLKEKRAALISHTITRGLPPDVALSAGLEARPKLKPSGIEWLGDIPEHWDITTFKRVCTRVDVGIAEAATHAYCDNGVPIIRSTNVRPNELQTEEILHIESWFADKNRSKTLRTGDLVTVRTGYLGTTAVIPSQLNGSQCFTLVLSTPKADTHGPFFAYLFNSKPGASYFEMEGWGTAQTNISVPIVQFMPVPRPPLHEQRAIADYLDRETQKTNLMIAKVAAAIERLGEYRAALIAAAVTGKIDVRNCVVA